MKRLPVWTVDQMFVFAKPCRNYSKNRVLKLLGESFTVKDLLFLKIPDGDVVIQFFRMLSGVEFRNSECIDNILNTCEVWLYECKEYEVFEGVEYYTAIFEFLTRNSYGPYENYKEFHVGIEFRSWALALAEQRPELFFDPNNIDHVNGEHLEHDFISDDDSFFC